MRIRLHPVSNFPASGTQLLDMTTAVYVEKLNRIYFIGRRTSYQTSPNGTTVDGIWYIDLTTLCPEELSCVGKVDGNYPHPFDCAKYIRCQREVLTEMSCPEDLLFDPVIKACNFPELVDFDETCM